MARLIKPDGTDTKITPANGVNWTVEELRELVGDDVEALTTKDGRFMIIAEHGKFKHEDGVAGYERNPKAQAFVNLWPWDFLVGPAVLVDSDLEMNGPEEEEE